MSEKKVGKAISLHFHPNQFENKQHTIEKSDSNGVKRRYLAGVSSGLNVDAHGERMTEKCIKGFMDQANKGDVLLYPDIHGIKASEDIGMLVKAEILPHGDWYTEYRLYDEQDGIGTYKAEKIDTLWKQINGLPPYKKARQMGYSIEGIIPEDSIIMNSMGELDRQVIDSIDLDGVVLVPRPAYHDSIATGVYKALGLTTPERAESIQTSLKESVMQDKIQQQYYKAKWDYQDALESMIEKIMKKSNNNKQEELDILFNEYKDLMIQLVLNSESIFADEQDAEEVDIQGGHSPYSAAKSTDPRLALFKALHSELNKFANMLEAK